MKLKPELLQHPNIPKPLHGLNPRTIKGKEWWDKTRQKAYASTDYHCKACGVHKEDALFHQWLECHEDYTIDYNKGIVEINSFVPLCHACHNFIHSGRLHIMHAKNDISLEKFKDILIHGCSILVENNLKGFLSTIKMAKRWITIRPLPEIYDLPTKMADWNEWHLILEGKKYYSLYKDFNAWKNHYSK